MHYSSTITAVEMVVCMCAVLSNSQALSPAQACCMLSWSFTFCFRVYVMGQLRIGAPGGAMHALEWQHTEKAVIGLIGTAFSKELWNSKPCGDRGAEEIVGTPRPLPPPRGGGGGAGLLSISKMCWG